MPYRKRKKYRSNRSSRNPNKSLKHKQKRKVSLLTRATLSNYRIIKKLNRSIETKLIDSLGAIAADAQGYLGQWAHINANNHGLDNGSDPSLLHPFYGISQGPKSNQRSGNQVVLKSLTYKISASPSGGSTVTSGSYIDVGCIVFLDRHPADDCNLNGVYTGTGPTATWGANNNTLMVCPMKDTGSTPAFGEQPMSLHYQNMDTCAGPDARYKILRHHRGRIWNRPTSGDNLKSAAWRTSGTVKNHYKVNYEDQETASATTGAFDPMKPVNQAIKIFFYSSVGELGAPTNPPPTFKVCCRYRYKDA